MKDNLILSLDLFSLRILRLSMHILSQGAFDDFKHEKKEKKCFLAKKV